MPIYQYKCIGCNLTTEKIQSKPLSITKCEHCNGLAERTVEAHAKTARQWVVK